MPEGRNERLPLPKFPFGRMAALRHGFWSFASGLVTLLTLGEVQPGWTLQSAYKTNLRARRRAAHPGSSIPPQEDQ